MRIAYVPSVESFYKNKYNGKELQDELGLNMTAMDFRQYDNAIGRFVSMDRLCELTHSITPYRFAFNNPLVFSDPTGLFEDGSNGHTDYYENNGIVYYDPKVYGPEDVPVGAKYIGKTYYNERENIFWDENGIPSNGGIQIKEVIVENKKRDYSPSFTDIIGFSTGFTGLYSDIRWKGLENIAKYGNKFKHTNGKFYSQNYSGGRWHSAESVKASKLKFNSNLKFISRVSNGMVVVGAAATIYDGVSNGWENHHTADLAVTAILYGIAATNPLGWVVGGVFFVADQATKAYTGKSITENLFED